MENFYWQDGHGAFSVHHSQVEIVARYIRNQSEHHRNRDFKPEYRMFLKKYKVNYDERYVWG